jgi:hypothetical protein
MRVVDEVRSLWAKLESHFSQLVGVPIATRGLAGRASGKQFIPAELSNGRVYLAIEGREGTPKRPTSIQPSDFEACLLYERRQITSGEARKSFRTSYAGPLIERLRQLPN